MKLGANRTEVLRARFRQTRRYQAAVLVPVGGAVFLLAHAPRYAVDFGLLPVVLGALFLLAIAVASTWINWRCPVCHEHLGLRVNPDHCPACRFRLRSR